MIKCLIIEDNHNNAQIASFILEELGIESEIFLHAKDALTRIPAGGFDFILLDWMMPEMDGIAFLHALRKKQGNHDAKVIMCTAKGAQDAQKTALDAGANFFMNKPITLDSIRTALSQIAVDINR